MSRFVKALPLGLKTNAAAAEGDSTAAKEYLERIGKYVPGEIIAGYTGLNALLVTFPEQIKYASYIILFLLCWILTPIYFKIISTPTDQPSVKTQSIVSGFAFLLWAYAIDGGKGIFGSEVLNIYNQSVGAALLIVFSMISGAIIPRK